MDYITIKEAVSLTGKSEATIRRLVKKATSGKPKKAKKEKTASGYQWFISKEFILSETDNKTSNETIDPKKERVLNYLCMINTMKVTPENLFYVFEEYIGKIDDVTPIEYKHIHPLLRKFIDNYKERNRREFNLEILSR